MVIGPTTLVTEALLLMPVGLIMTPCGGLTSDGAAMVSGLLRDTELGSVLVGRGMPLGTTMPVVLVTWGLPCDMIGRDSSDAMGLGVVFGGRGGTTAQLGGTFTGMPGRVGRLLSVSVGREVLIRFSAGSPESSLPSSCGLKNKNKCQFEL